MNRPRVIAAATLIATCGAIIVPQLVAAHHNTVSCQSPGVWLIVNSEADKAEMFTTDQGHSGSIPAGGSTTVAYSGTHLEVDGLWSNGVTNHAEGDGDCIDNTTTTTTEVSTSTTTTIVETSTTSTSTPTTEPSTSTTTSAPTTAPPTTTSPSTTTPPVVSTSTVPPTTVPECVDNPATPEDDCAPACTPVFADLNGDGDTTDPNENSCVQARLPATL